jgi:hypothetical protein
VDGETNGPVSRSHPLAHPVAAVPTNVGEKVPRLEEETVELPGFAMLADAPGEDANSIEIGSPRPRRMADRR